MSKIDKNTPQGKGIRTAYQAVAAAVMAYLYGLWSLPGVSEYTTEFLQTEGLSLLLTLAVVVGVPAGIISFVQNKRGK